GLTPASVLSLPFDRIDVEGSTLVIPLPKGLTRARASVAGWLRRADNGTFQFDLTITLGARPLHASGSIGPTTGDIDATIAGDGLDAATAAAIASAFTPDAAISADGTFALAGTLHAAPAGGNISLKLTPASLAFTITSTKSSAPPAQATNVDSIGGVFKAEAAFAPGQPLRGRLTMKDVALNATSLHFAAEGVAGEIAFDDLLHLTTADHQSLGIGKISIGEAEFTKASATFVLRRGGGAGVGGAGSEGGARGLDLQTFRCNWLGGVLWTSDVHLDLTRPVMQGTAHISGVDLHQLLELVTADKATGEGSASGELPIAIDWPGVKFGAAQLKAAPGGTIKIKDLTTMSAALDQMGKSQQAELKQRILEALGDFKYDTLQANLVQDEMGLGANVHIAGRGRSGARQALDTELRFHGLDDVLKLYLGFERHQASANKPPAPH
ncbi:MAG TPA: YdbH domain-containing protein, partial [Tepidisphaeraceae bacterium]